MCIIKFEWDPEKAEENLIKHGISFDESTVVFEDPFAVEDIDIRYEEPRFVRVGLAASRILLVVYTIRGKAEDIYRIISARKATSAEQQSYFEQRYEA